MDKKKRLITMVVTLLVLTIGVTFAYFMARTGEGKQAGTTITTGIVDDLKFNVSKENLSLNINQFNFASGSGNITDTVTATASLKANSTKNTATYNYYVYFQIESNDYVYTTTDKKPEIVLSITGPNGEITSVDGLKYVSATNADGTIVKGFDITTLGKSITKIANAYEISSSSSTNYTNQEWTFTVTFINLDTNQVGNQNKNLTGKVLIQQDKIVDSISVVAKSGDALATTLESLGTKGDSSLTGLYYHDSSLTNGAGDNSYRFAGASDQVNNYVCFGSNVTPCPADNLYRIIGVFGDKVKLIKSTSVGNKRWNSTDDNTWSTSSLNTYLNNEFINAFDETTKGKIAETTWKVGGFSNYKQPANTVYQNEINSSPSETKKIGLMYASDYGFAAAPSAWTTNLYDYDGTAIKSANWMYLGANEWTISRDADYSRGALNVYDAGNVGFNYVSINAYGVRPVFSLTSSVNYVSGSGSATDPITIN